MADRVSGPDQCLLCGADPAAGNAAINGKRLCHDGWATEPTCYMTASARHREAAERLGEPIEDVPLGVIFWSLRQLAADLAAPLPGDAARPPGGALVAGVNADALAVALKALHAPAAELHPFALVDDSTGEPVIQVLGNGMTYVATYRTAQGARRGCARWGGVIVQRSTGVRL